MAVNHTVTVVHLLLSQDFQKEIHVVQTFSRGTPGYFGNNPEGLVNLTNLQRIYCGECL